MIRTTPIRWIFVALFLASLLGACGARDASGDKEPAAKAEVEDKKVEAPADKDDTASEAKEASPSEEQAALTAEEEAALKDEFDDEAEAAITAENAQGELDKLEAEINEDQ